MKATRNESNSSNGGGLTLPLVDVASKLRPRKIVVLFSIVTASLASFYILCPYLFSYADSYPSVSSSSSFFWNSASPQLVEQESSSPQPSQQTILGHSSASSEDEEETELLRLAIALNTSDDDSSSSNDESNAEVGDGEGDQQPSALKRLRGTMVRCRLAPDYRDDCYYEHACFDGERVLDYVFLSHSFLSLTGLPWH